MPSADFKCYVDCFAFLAVPDHYGCCQHALVRLEACLLLLSSLCNISTVPANYGFFLLLVENSLQVLLVFLPSLAGTWPQPLPGPRDILATFACILLPSHEVGLLTQVSSGTAAAATRTDATTSTTRTHRRC